MWKKKKRSTFSIFGLHDRDLAHHAILVAVLAGGLLGILSTSHSKYLQFTIGFVVAVLYVAWGVFHHYHDGDLHVKNVMEYVLLALLGILILAVLFL